MAAFDLGLIDGNDWDAANVDAIEAQIQRLLPLGRIPRACATKNSVQTIPMITDTAVTWPDTEDYDTDGFHSTSVNTERFTIPAGLGGVYRVSYAFYVSTVSNGRGQAYITKNGGGERWAWQGWATGSSAEDTACCGTADMVMVAGDWIRVGVYVNTGSARPIGIVGIPSRFSITWVGPSDG